MTAARARCDVCSAPAVSLAGACAFCRSPLAEDGDSEELLAYLAERLPVTRVKRGARLGRGGLRELAFQGEAQLYRAQLRRGRLHLNPDLALPEWVDQVLVEVSRLAASDPDLRRTVSRSGWAFR